jgi:hypothetical protein
MSINIIVAIAGICLIDMCYIFVIHTQQDVTQRNETVESMLERSLWLFSSRFSKLRCVMTNELLK